MFEREDRREIPLIAAAGGLSFCAMAILSSMVDRGAMSAIGASVPQAAYETLKSGEFGIREELGQGNVAPVRRPPASEEASLGAVVAKNGISQERLSTNLAALFWLVLSLLACGLALIALLSDTRKKARINALTDSLTGLPNRRAFCLNVENYLKTAGHRDELEIAFLLFDIDNFKLVNDEHGHDSGDELLRAFGKRVSAAIDKDCLYARLGGDEFALALFGKAAGARMHAMADQLIALNRMPYDVFGRHISSTSSIGGVAYHGKRPDGATIMRQADIALYGAKDRSRNTACFFEPSMEEAANRRVALMRDLRRAVELGELSLNFQPIVDLDSSRLVSFESLLRWEHAVHGFVSPAEFIPLAEESGLIIPIGFWVIEEACRVASRWPRHINFTVNLSPRQFGDENLVGTILRSLESNSVAPTRMTVEITETAIIENDSMALEALTMLRARGVKIALDDFGTGFASLSYLIRFPFDVVKIDQSFVREARRNKNAEVVIASTCELAARLGLETVAEGIESEEHLRFVKEAGCMRGQGYLFGRPERMDECATRIALDQLKGIPRGPGEKMRTGFSLDPARQTISLRH